MSRGSEGDGAEPAAGRTSGGASAVGDGDRANEELPSLPVRVWELLVAPGRLFDRLRERPAWIGAVVLMVATAVLTTFLLPEELLREAATASMPEDATAEQVETAARFARIGGYAGSVVGPPLSVAAVAGVLLFFYNLVLGGAARYRQLVAVTGHALLIPTLGGLAMVPLLIATGDPQTALAMHLLVPGLEEGFLFRLLRGLGVFGLWTSVLLGLAVSRVYPERRFGTSAGVVLALYVGMKASWALLAGFGPA